MSLVNFNNATMFKHNGSILTMSKYRTAGKHDKYYPNGPQRFPSSCSFTFALSLRFLGHLILREGNEEDVGIAIFNIQIPDISACYRQNSNPKHSWNPHVNYHIIKSWKDCELLYKESE